MERTGFLLVITKIPEIKANIVNTSKAQIFKPDVIELD